MASLGSLVATFTLAGCGLWSDPVPSELVVHGGDGQEGNTGRPVASPVQVRVGDGEGVALGGVTVDFRVVSGGGSIGSSSGATDDSGLASPGAWTMGPPGRQELVASVDGLASVTIRATSLDYAVGLAILDGDGQRATTGQAVAVPVQIGVVGTTGEALAGTEVSFTVLEGGGAVELASAVSDSGGVASPGAWTLGTPGPQRLGASVEGVEELVVHAYARGIPAKVEFVAGDGQEAMVATAVPIPPVAVVSDSTGVPLAEIPVFFRSERDAEVEGAEAVTDADGRASVESWTLGTVTGDYWLEAIVEGRDSVEPARVAARALPGPAAQIEAIQGDGQTTEAGLPVPVVPQVGVLDEYGNAVPDETVRFEARGGSAVTPTERDTDEDGYAAVDMWILGTTADVTYTLAAEAGDEEDPVGPVVFTATSTPAVYDLEILLVDSSALSAGQLDAFESAELYWEDAITGNLPWAIVLKASLERCLEEGDIELEVPGDRVVDDLLLYTDVREIDGPGGVFAAAGPCQIRSESGLPVVGLMYFDSDDLDEMEEEEEGVHLEGTILHEMAHAMGFGTIWEYLELLEDPVDLEDPRGDEDPHFIGEEALVAFDSVGGESYDDGEPVPVHDQGGHGVANGHWREVVFDDELMTPYLDGGARNPLSIVTLASMQDLGYDGVDLGMADDYELPESEPQARPIEPAQPRSPSDILAVPIAVADRLGRVLSYLTPLHADRRSSQ